MCYCADLTQHDSMSVNVDGIIYAATGALIYLSDAINFHSFILHIIR